MANSTRLKTNVEQNIIETTLCEYYSTGQIIESKVLCKQAGFAEMEPVFYKALEKLKRQQKIQGIGKGLYCIPEKTVYGLISLSETEIVQQLTEDERGMVVGYFLYNRLRLTTQIAKNIEVYSTFFEEKHHTVKNVNVYHYDLQYSSARKKIISFLEILSHYYEIQDLNHYVFLSLCKKAATTYDETITKEVIAKIGYPKRAIAFLQNVLAYFHVSNGLSDYLSPHATYKIPQMKTLYEEID